MRQTGNTSFICKTPTRQSPTIPEDDDELYDPNDDAAVEAFWRQGVLEGRVTRGVGKDAVVLKPEDFGWEK